MLHAAPTSETKTEAAQSKSQLALQPERELYPHTPSAAGLYSLNGVDSGMPGRSLEEQRRQMLAGMQRTYGNQAVLRTMQSSPQVARMTALRPSQGVMLQRKCACGGSSESEGECAECQAKDEGTLQRLASDQTTPSAVGNVPPIVHGVLSSPGQSLDARTRAFMEPRFRQDFSQVRVHTDAKAAESARAVNALAYTVGRDVVFGTGQYAPGTSEGRRLMAHELTHVVQQQRGNISNSKQGKLTVGQSGGLYEQEADRAAETLLSSNLVTSSFSYARESLLQRQDDELSEEEASPQEYDEPSEEEASPQEYSAKPTTPCPTSVRIGSVTPKNHSDLSEEEKSKWRTYISALSRMEVGPGPNYTGHYMIEKLVRGPNDCPEQVRRRGGKCARHDELLIGQFGSGPNAFFDAHRTRSRRSLLEGTDRQECSVTCEQTYSCDGKPVDGTFLITRTFRADTYTTKAGKTIPITTGSITKTPKR